MHPLAGYSARREVLVQLRVKQVFATMQGEGSRTGAPCVFIRLSGCNLWAGTPSTRSTGAGVCSRWCDTDFHGGDSLQPGQVVASAMALMADWPAPAVVISGGEPCLQLRRAAGEALVWQLHQAGVHVAVETNGTVPADVLAVVDHVTVSPKLLAADVPDRLAHVLVRQGTDLKVVAPQWTSAEMMAMADWSFAHRYLQPLDLGGGEPATMADEVLRLAQRIGWRVSLQTHKLVGLP
jgi:organic radical activating enzyme